MGSHVITRFAVALHLHLNAPDVSGLNSSWFHLCENTTLIG